MGAWACLLALLHVRAAHSWVRLLSARVAIRQPYADRSSRPNAHAEVLVSWLSISAKASARLAFLGSVAEMASAGLFSKECAGAPGYHRPSRAGHFLGASLLQGLVLNQQKMTAPKPQVRPAAYAVVRYSNQFVQASSSIFEKSHLQGGRLMAERSSRIQNTLSTSEAGFYPSFINKAGLRPAARACVSKGQMRLRIPLATSCSACLVFALCK